MINYWADPVDLPTMVNRSKLPINRLKREDMPASRRWARGSSAFPTKARGLFLLQPVLPGPRHSWCCATATGTPLAVAIGLESRTYADVKKIDPLAPCFRLGAFGTEGLNTKRVNGLFSFLVADPAQSP